jgi:restriction system protein
MARKSKKRQQEEEQGIGAILAVVLLFLWYWYTNAAWIQLAAGITFTLTALLIAWRLTSTMRRRNLTRSRLLDLTPYEFEDRIAMLLKDNGWAKVKVTGGSGDQGVDITAEKDGETWVIQCKRYKDAIAPGIVREMVGTKRLHQADRAVLATTSSFTAQGKTHAKQGSIDLWDGNTLAQMIAQREAAHSPAISGRLVILYTLMLLGSATMLLWLLTEGFSPIRAISPL